jgi:hypothetical protein
MTMRRLATAVIPVSFLAAACGTIPGMSSSQAERTAVDPDTVQLTTEHPGTGYRRMSQMTGYAEGECQGPRAERSLSQARSDLRERAAASGADYVRVLGVGPLANRGGCQDDTYRVSGVPYVKTDDTPSSDGGPSDDADTSSEAASSSSTPEKRSEPAADSSTADKLAEIEALREKGLISEQEYQRLRERVLDEAF